MKDDLTPGEPFASTIVVGGRAYERLVLRTHWIEPGEDIIAVVRHYVGPHVEPGDCVIVSEKATVIATGRGVPAGDVPPGRLARLLARSVRPVGNSRGLSIPEKMQLVISHTGRARVIAAAAASAITRPLAS